MLIIYFLLSSLHFIEITCKHKYHGFIVNGMKSDDHQFAYCAHLGVSCAFYPNRPAVSWFCGSSIVNQKLLLTAAHCLYPCKKVSAIVKAGHANRLGGFAYRMSSYKMHEKYNNHEIINDIALVILKKPMRLDVTRQRVALIRKPNLKEKFFVAGWGEAAKGNSDNNENAQTPVTLRYVQQRFVSHDKCVRVVVVKSPGTICAQDATMKAYPSVGDSGSPMVIRRYIQVGIVSYSVPETHKYLIVYTYVPYFMDWISKSARNMYCNSVKNAG